MLFRFIWQANLGNALGAFSRAPNSRWTPCTVQIWSNHLPKFWSLCLHPLNCSIFPRLKRCLEPTYLLLIGLVVMFIVEHSSNGCDGSKGTGLRVFLVEKYPWIACLSPIILFCYCHCRCSNKFTDDEPRCLWMPNLFWMQPASAGRDSLTFLILVNISWVDQSSRCLL